MLEGEGRRWSSRSRAHTPQCTFGAAAGLELASWMFCLRRSCNRAAIEELRMNDLVLLLRVKYDKIHIIGDATEGCFRW